MKSRAFKKIGWASALAIGFLAFKGPEVFYLAKDAVSKHEREAELKLIQDALYRKQMTTLAAHINGPESPERIAEIVAEACRPEIDALTAYFSRSLETKLKRQDVADARIQEALSEYREATAKESLELVHQNVVHTVQERRPMLPSIAGQGSQPPAR